MKSIIPAVVLMLSLTGELAGAAAAVAALSPAERRDLLIPQYLRAVGEPLLREYATYPPEWFEEAANLDQYLRDLPLSPLEMLKIDMHLGRYEVVVPRFLFEEHQRWMVLHLVEAHRLYSEGEIAAALAASGFTSEAEVMP